MKLARRILLLGMALFIGASTLRIINNQVRASDMFVRNQVLKITGEHGGCTAVRVIAPSGKTYVLTARHCKDILVHDKVLAEDESGHKTYLTLIEVDKRSDLMLLSSDVASGVNVASKVALHEALHSLTHGDMKPTYRTDGEALNQDLVTIPVFPVADAADEARCKAGDDQDIREGNFFMPKVCVITLLSQITTVRIVPGSSGGPVLNEAGELVGIASAAEDNFSFFVTLGDIHRFLKAR